MTTVQETYLSRFVHDQATVGCETIGTGDERFVLAFAQNGKAFDGVAQNPIWKARGDSERERIGNDLRKSSQLSGRRE